MALAKRLQKYGNGYAIIVDRPLLDALGIDPTGEVNLSVESDAIVLRRAGALSDEERRRKIAEASAEVFQKYDRAFEKLAEGPT